MRIRKMMGLDVVFLFSLVSSHKWSFFRGAAGRIEYPAAAYMKRASPQIPLRDAALPTEKKTHV